MFKHTTPKRRLIPKSYMVYLSFIVLVTCTSVTLLGYAFISDTSNSRFHLQMVINRSAKMKRYNDRANHLRETCSYLKDRVRKVQYDNLNTMQQIYTLGNMSICVVPKSGCSFLKRLIYYLSDPQQLLYMDNRKSRKLDRHLRSIEEVQQKIFNLSRLEIHYTLDLTQIKITEEQFKNGSFHKVIVARNPYTRLYSAYIDKVFVPVFNDVFEEKQKLMFDKGLNLTKSQLCSDYVSFEDFLEIVVSNTRMSKGDSHWLPTSALCNACEVNPDIVIKQETYHQDIDFFLSQTDMNETQWKTINSVIARQGIQTDSIIKGLIITMYFKGLKSKTECFSKIQIARRVWEALKIQGQIYQYLEFPGKKLRAAKRLSLLTLADIFLTEMKKMPITAEESRYQRETAISRAYRHVRSELLIKIQAMFYYDFLMFEYDFNPPGK